MDSQLNIVAFIFARGGSKGVPGKNIRPFAGKPLIAYAIETGLKSKYIKEIIVSTDDNAIKNIALRYGAIVPFIRPSELAQDNSSEWLAWRHAINKINATKSSRPIDIFVSIPTTAPLRSTRDVDKCIEQLLTSPETDIVITVKKASRHPSFNMVAIDQNGYANIIIPPDEKIIRRQDIKPVYDMTTVAYVTKPAFVLKANSIFEGKVKTVLIPEERAVDIDTEFDFAIAEFLMRKTTEL